MRVSVLVEGLYDANATFALGCKGETSPCAEVSKGGKEPPLSGFLRADSPLSLEKMNIKKAHLFNKKFIK